MPEVNTVIAVTTKRKRRFIKVSASNDWLESMKVYKDNAKANAIVVERAYKLLDLQQLAGNKKIEASSLHFTTEGISGATSLIPGMEPMGATSNWCCICNDADPPECACVPC
ncbi:MAG: hypothetical protein GY947_00510 [Rhodobacteraceae bacterium]|nr:hypothetical protein [Paracoccaceae bacterium]